MLFTQNHQDQSMLDENKAYQSWLVFRAAVYNDSWIIPIDFGRNRSKIHIAGRIAAPDTTCSVLVYNVVTIPEFISVVTDESKSTCNTDGHIGHRPIL